MKLTLSQIAQCGLVVIAMLATDLSANAVVPGYSVLHDFSGSGDGASPYSALVSDAKGNFYGTTVNGGLGAGTIYKIAPDGSEIVLYQFAGGNDGAYPTESLLINRAGDILGATGGGGNQACGGGCGVIFKLSKKGVFSALYRFSGGSDGAGPSSLMNDANGNLVGVTVGGGGTGCDGLGCGTIFRLAPDNTKTVLYTFAGNSDGANPVGGVVADPAGNLYGVTESGGVICGIDTDRYCGTVFKLDLTGSFCTKRFDRNELGKELSHAKEEVQCGADRNVASTD